MRSELQNSRSDALATMSRTGYRAARDPSVTCEEGHNVPLRSVFAATPRKCRSGGRQCVNSVEKDALAARVTTAEGPGGRGLVNREQPSRAARRAPEGAAQFLLFGLLSAAFSDFKKSHVIA